MIYFYRASINYLDSANKTLVRIFYNSNLQLIESPVEKVLDHDHPGCY